jgi:CRISPR/Cas system-associated exonuclease Cas4 (RecB family)
MEIPYRPEKVTAAGRRFDQVVSRIQARDFTVLRTPEAKVCKECDLKALCGAEGIA